MHIRKAIVTAASRRQRTLPLQTLIDSDGVEKSVLGIIIEEALGAGIEEICVVICPGDERAYAQAAGGLCQTGGLYRTTRADGLWPCHLLRQ